jgi:hypothetical protein
MLKKRGRLLSVLMGLLLALPLAAVPAAGAQAAPAVPGACYDGYVYLTVYADSGTLTFPSSTGYYTTTSRCVDINFYNQSWQATYEMDANIRVCFVSTGSCNSWKRYDAKTSVTWMLIATNVKDGTRFRVQMSFAEKNWGGRYTNRLAF